MSNPFKTFERQITEEKSEIKELKKAYDIISDHLVRAEQQLRDKDKLITELAEVLKKVRQGLDFVHSSTWDAYGVDETLQRAREATK